MFDVAHSEVVGDGGLPDGRWAEDGIELAEFFVNDVWVLDAAFNVDYGDLVEATLPSLLLLAAFESILTIVL